MKCSCPGTRRAGFMHPISNAYTRKHEICVIMIVETMSFMLLLRNSLSYLSFLVMHISIFGSKLAILNASFEM
jgi:hypothetical protein